MRADGIFRTDLILEYYIFDITTEPYTFKCTIIKILLLILLNMVHIIKNMYL